MPSAVRTWFERTFVDLAQELRWSFLPPLMVYFAAGISGLTGIVGTFFVKEYLGLSAAVLASLGFWAGLPWVLKIPLGHLVDIFWRQKALLVYFGAGLIAASLLIMYALIAHTAAMRSVMSAEAWYVLAALLSPAGYVIQDTVADAMSVEAVPRVHDDGTELADAETKALHTTMQTLGRIALIGGLVFVSLLNIVMFSGVDALDAVRKAEIYADIHLIALAIPIISVSGVILAGRMQRRRAHELRTKGLGEAEIDRIVFAPEETAQPNAWIFGGGALFVALTLLIGLTDVPFGQELVFLGSLVIICALILRLVKRLTPDKARALVGTAVIIFVFRAVPLPGAGATWFQIDVLGFDQRFLAVLSLIASVLTLVGMLVLRPMMAKRTIVYIVVVLTLAATILSVPNVALYYGVHEWTARLTGGLVDARFIAVINTALESPLGQVAMIPMLAWIARNAPGDLKATFFAVMASFTNLALSASNLFTKYLNEIFVVTREVRNAETGLVETAADYSELGILLIVVTLIGLVAPLLIIVFVQQSPLASRD